MTANGRWDLIRHLKVKYDHRYSRFISIKILAFVNKLGLTTRVRSGKSCTAISCNVTAISHDVSVMSGYANTNPIWYCRWNARQALRSTLPSTEWIPGALSSGVKQPRREADHPHSVQRLRMIGAVYIFHLHTFMACRRKTTSTFTFTVAAVGNALTSFCLVLSILVLTSGESRAEGLDVKC